MQFISKTRFASFIKVAITLKTLMWQKYCEKESVFFSIFRFRPGRLNLNQGPVWIRVRFGAATLKVNVKCELKFSVVEVR